MAHLWQFDNSVGWKPCSLAMGENRIPAAMQQSEFAPTNPSENLRLFVLEGSPSRAIVMTAVGEHIRVNGVAVGLGVRVLNDRDEIGIIRSEGPTSRFYFSTESLAAVEPFSPGEHAARCPRCKLMIEAGMPAVRCPQCEGWHHEGAVVKAGGTARNCWSYSERCALCSQSTSLDAGFQWTPEAL